MAPIEPEPVPGQANRVAVETNLRQGFVRMRQIRDADPTVFGDLPAAQRDAHLFAACQDTAQAVIWLARLLLLEVRDGTD